MKLSKEQKKSLASQLSHSWGAVDLICDGYRVALRVERYKTLSYRVMTYVNGQFSGKWISAKDNAPESKFLRKSVRPNYSPAKRRELEKALGKRYVKNNPFFSGSITIYLPDWSPGAAAINHLCKVCESIEIAEAEIIQEPA